MMPMTNERDQRAEHDGQRFHGVFGFLFVALGESVHRFDGLAAFFGHGQRVDELAGNARLRANAT